MGKPDAATEREILACEKALDEALIRGDTAWVLANWTADAIYVHQSGNVENGPQLTARLASGVLVFLERQSEGVEVRTYGSTAVVTGGLRTRLLTEGVERRSEMRFARVYVKENGRWLMAASQAGNLAKH